RRITSNCRDEDRFALGAKWMARFQQRFTTRPRRLRTVLSASRRFRRKVFVRLLRGYVAVTDRRFGERAMQCRDTHSGSFDDCLIFCIGISVLMLVTVSM